MNRAKALILILIIFFSYTLQAKEIGKYNFENMIQIPSVDSPLKLNGLGIRHKFFFKIYAAALYVQQKSVNPDSIISSPDAKRMVMHILYSEVDKKKLTDGWLDGFEANLSKTDFIALKPDIIKFNTMFETLHSGDLVFLDYLPDQGTRVTIKGQDKGIIPNQKFYSSLLKIWLGDKPVSSSLKKELLNQ